MNQEDERMIQAFYDALEKRCRMYGIPLRQAGTHQERCHKTGDVYLVSFFFQIMMIRYELFININVTDKADRYGWRVA
jgi:hypothetical protein